MDMDTLPLPPRRRSRKTALRTQYISIAKKLIDKAYLIEDEEALKSLTTKMENLLKEATHAIKTDNGMPVHVPPKKVRASSPIPKELPKGTGTGRPKSTLTGRVGERAEKMREAQKAPKL